jgi:hypothetical protein
MDILRLLGWVNSSKDVRLYTQMCLVARELRSGGLLGLLKIGV